VVRLDTAVDLVLLVLNSLGIAQLKEGWDG
jgi:hypothetical protein